MSYTNSTRRPHNFTDLTGQQFRDWTVLKFIENTASKARWWCRCSCGCEAAVRASHLSGGGSLRCRSCAARISATRHGKTDTREYKSWDSMRSRCYRPTDTEYHNYGGRGITVCTEWESFEAFYADMGTRPDGTTLERLDNSLGYFPSNCVWADGKAQGRNRRTNVVVEYDGRSQCLSAWAEELGMSRECLYQRLKRGWSIERSLTEPVRR